MNRLEFLRRSALIAAGAVAADQFDLMDRLGWTRRFFAGFGPGTVKVFESWPIVTSAQWDALLKEVYSDPFAVQFINAPLSFVLRREPKSLIHPRLWRAVT